MRRRPSSLTPSLYTDDKFASYPAYPRALQPSGARERESSQVQQHAARLAVSQYQDIASEIEQSSRLLSYECIVSRVPTATPSLFLGLLHAPAPRPIRIRATLNYLVNEITSRVELGLANSCTLYGLESLSLSLSLSSPREACSVPLDNL